MADVILKMPVMATDTPALDRALSAFASWRDLAAEPHDEDDAPAIMMKTARQGSDLVRLLVFQERREAAAFLTFFRHFRRRAGQLLDS